ncbi:hypothetical protein [Falsibacillus albus]|uniref:Uncharacterized protein n=1 Tax=Falsibacillus albus TaxID=2478915 RepID=A0A3L7JV09_9BACI|nr:hypothetical protein [Falsibacillus albus]RLQ94360.1 hypothetical protein D9X91_15015 [Falsibacillus albus]
MNKKEFRKYLHHYISDNPVFTKKEEQKILKSIFNDSIHDKRNRGFRYPAAIIMVCLLFLLFLPESDYVFHLHHTLKAPASNHSRLQSADISDKLILEKAEQIKRKLSMKMTKEEAEKEFGKPTIKEKVQNPEGEPLEGWTYQFFKAENSKGNSNLPSGDIDVGNLKERHIGIELSLNWNEDAEIQIATLAYVQGKENKVIINFFKKDGSVQTIEQ